MNNIENRGSIKGYVVFIVVIFLILIFRLFNIQIINHDKYQEESDRNFINKEVIKAKRGEIYDKNGNLVAANRANMTITVSTINSQEEIYRSLHNVAKYIEPLGISEEEITEKYEEAKKVGQKGEVPVAEIPYDIAQGIEISHDIMGNSIEMPAVNLKSTPTRYYPYNNLLGVSIGYVNRISQEEFEANPNQYTMDAIVGKSGLERSYEIYSKEGTKLIGLAGKNGSRQIEVDGQNNNASSFGFTKPATPGDNLTLTIDMQTQAMLVSALEREVARTQRATGYDKVGSAAGIVMNPNTGEILAMASLPSFNPNDFAGTSLPKDIYESYSKDLRAPLVDKVVSTPYPPGSTFKMVTGMAGLQYTPEAITPETRFTCTGKYWEPPYIRCTGRHGSVPIKTALQYSCNVYFQATGQAAGIDNISKTATQFGLGVDTGFTDIDNASKGFLPSRETKARKSERERDARIAYITTESDKELKEIEKDDSLKPKEKELKIIEVESNLEKETQKAVDKYNSEKAWYKYDTFNSSIGQGYNNYTILQLGQYVSTIANGGTRYRPYMVSKISSYDNQEVYNVEPMIMDQVEISPENIAEIQKGMRAVVTGGSARSALGRFRIPVAGKTGTAETGRIGESRTGAKLFHGLFVSYAPFNNPEIAVAIIIEYGDKGSKSAVLASEDFYRQYYKDK